MIPGSVLRPCDSVCAGGLRVQNVLWLAVDMNPWDRAG